MFRAYAMWSMFGGAMFNGQLVCEGITMILSVLAANWMGCELGSHYTWTNIWAHSTLLLNTSRSPQDMVYLPSVHVVCDETHDCLINGGSSPWVWGRNGNFSSDRTLAVGPTPVFGWVFTLHFSVMISDRVALIAITPRRLFVPLNFKCHVATTMLLLRTRLF